MAKPKLNSQKATQIVRQYFDDVKKTKFLFDVRNVSFDEGDEVWIVECEITNLFDKQPRLYTIRVEDTGDIIDVEEE